MALIKCADCGKEISDKAKACPNCGCPVDVQTPQPDQSPINESVVEETTATQMEPTNTEAPDALENVSQNANDDNTTPTDTKGVDIKNLVNKAKDFALNNKKAVIIGASAIALIIVLIIVISCVSGNKKPKNNTTPTVPTVNNVLNEVDDDVADTSEISYISDRTWDYDEPNDQYRIFFAFSDANKNYLTASGTATIEITNEAEEVVYSEDIAFDESDFSSWSNKFRDETRQLCCIYINREDIDKGSSERGSLTLSADADGVWFDPHTCSNTINNLPTKSLEIKMPSFPKSYSEHDYDGYVDKTVEISEITYTTDVNYDGSATAKLSITTKMTYNYSGTPDYTYIEYKLKNSSGVIVDSGTFMISKSNTGDTAVTEEYFFDLSMQDTYTLELADHY